MGRRTLGLIAALLDNRLLGINAVAGVTDLGGNRAHGNGDPLQCRNVFCAP